MSEPGCLGDTQIGSVGRDISDEELLGLNLSVDDPEDLPGVCDEIPPDGVEVYIEYDYDVSDRDLKVRCVYCGFQNHFKGVVANYGEGRRCLIGRICAETRHGHIYSRAMRSFDALRSRQDYLLRRQNVEQLKTQIYEQLAILLQHPAAALYDRQVSAWRATGDLARDIDRIARADGNLVTKSRRRDFDEEKARKARLGADFARVRSDAKASGKNWQVYRDIILDRGPVIEPKFFKKIVGVENDFRQAVRAVGKTVDEIVGASSGDALKRLFNRLTRERDEMAELIDLLEELPEALSTMSLERIAAFANDQAQAMEDEAAMIERRRPVDIEAHYLVEDGMLREPGASRERVVVGLPEGYKPPRREIIQLLTEAVAAVQPKARPPF